MSIQKFAYLFSLLLISCGRTAAAPGNSPTVSAAPVATESVDSKLTTALAGAQRTEPERARISTVIRVRRWNSWVLRPT